MNRKEAAKWWNEAMLNKGHREKGDKWHVGVVEVRQFLDIIYGGPPACEEECVYSAWTLIHKKGA